VIAFGQNLIDALALGSLYALAALGIGLIFGVLRLINFAHGDYITVGAYSLIIPSTQVMAQEMLGALPWPLLIIAVTAVVVILALLSELIVFRPLRAASAATLMIASFALGFVIQYTLLLFYSGRPKAFGLWPELTQVVEFVGLRVPLLQLITISVTIVLLVGLVGFLRYTAYGVQMRAAAEDFRMARLLGVKANRVIALAFGLSGVLAAVVSLLFLTQRGIVAVDMGVPLMLFAFVATVVGGMGSLVGAVVGGYAVGILSVALQVLLPEDLRAFRDAFVFLAIIIILLFRPSGLVKVKAVVERV